MTIVATLPTLSYAAGSHPIPPSSIAAGATVVTATIDVSQMLNPATAFSFSFDLSYDAGTTWAFWAGGTRQGGPLLIDRHGNAITTCGLGGPLPAPANATTKIRGSVIVTGGSITIGGTVDVS